MLHYILKSTTEYRIETVEEVERFHKKLQGQAAAGQYQLSAFSYIEKEVKSSGEVVDSYFIVKVTFVFNDAKDPQLPIFDAEYPYAADALISSEKQED